jgi:methionyl-tRNA formyltransferase
VRIFLAGASGAELSVAAEAALRADPRVELVGVAVERIDASELRSARPDILVSAAHSYLIRSEELDIPSLGCVGIHPGMLPRYRGSYPLWWALKNGEPEVGLTLYRLGKGIDDGPILRQAVVVVHRGDTFASLYGRVVREVPKLVSWLLDTVAETGALPAGTPQDHRLATVVRTPGRAERAIWRARWAMTAAVALVTRTGDLPVER